MTAKEFYEYWMKPTWTPTENEAYFRNWIKLNGFMDEYEMAAKAYAKHLRKKKKKAA